MAGTDRFPEITTCNAAKKAVEDFDERHARKAAAIQLVARMLEKGGWGAVGFEEETHYVPPERRIMPDIEAVALADLQGDTIETIVRERRELYDVWRRAYGAVPVAIRNSAPKPGELIAIPPGRRRRT